MHFQPKDIMQISDWVLIGATLFLGIMALLAPYVVERWKYKFYSAKLEFKFFHRPPYCHITQGRGFKVDFPVYYFRFKISNEKGRVQAEQCEAVVEKIWKEHSAGQFKEFVDFSPVWLKWSGTQRTRYFTIQPKREIFCDIGRICHPDHEPDSVYQGIKEEEIAQNKFFFEWPDRFHSQWDCLLPGKYRIKIAVYSKNAKKISKKFNIAWSGVWKVQEPEMLNELVIS